MIQQRLSGQEVAQFRMTLGCMSVVGVVAMCITQNEKFNRLIPHAIGPFICGVVMMSITLAENDVSGQMYTIQNLKEDNSMVYSLSSYSLKSLTISIIIVLLTLVY